MLVAFISSDLSEGNVGDIGSGDTTNSVGSVLMKNFSKFGS